MGKIAVVIISSLAVLGAVSAGRLAGLRGGQDVTAQSRATISVRPAIAGPGNQVSVEGAGFGAAQKVEVSLAGKTIAHLRATSGGVVSATVQIPLNVTTAVHTLVARTPTSVAKTKLLVETQSYRVAAPPKVGAYLAIWKRGLPQKINALTTFEHLAGRHMAMAMFWSKMGGTTSKLNTAWLRTIAAHGTLPVISWEPETDQGDQAPYSLTSIAGGSIDPYIQGWARQLAAYGATVMIRVGDEMNGGWYSWGRQPDAYIAAWRHIHDIFVANHATNVKWLWTPNTQWDSESAFAPYYPGDRYVDWVGLDGYNKPQDGWQSFKQVFASSYAAMEALTKKPLMIAETGSSEPTVDQAKQGDSKSLWITNAYTRAIPSMPRIKAVFWFNEDKTVAEHCTCDWPIDSSPEAQRAFEQAIKSPYYIGYWR